MSDVIVICSKCGDPIGSLVVIDRIKLLKIGSLIVRSLHGACDCGQEFHFASNDAMLADLLARMLAPSV